MDQQVPSPLRLLPILYIFQPAMEKLPVVQQIGRDVLPVCQSKPVECAGHAEALQQSISPRQR